MEWRAIPGFVGRYEVSDEGQVRRVGTGRGVVKGRVLAQTNHKQGYKAISLWKENKGYTFLVHRLVAAAFLGEAGDNDVNHKNGVKTDNRLENLEYATRSENIWHAIGLGLIRPKGTDNPSNKLTEQQVRDIREMHASGTGYKTLAKLFDVSPELIRDIIKGRIWRHLGAIE